MRKEQVDIRRQAKASLAAQGPAHLLRPVGEGATVAYIIDPKSALQALEANNIQSLSYLDGRNLPLLWTREQLRLERPRNVAHLV